ncbi:MAG: SUMF1/EgtB/PvdO family nonheme iron enzyme [Gammaproteobacteria bacterium]|nr:SUMF1/EgtB/PvdO family nonheme iron enzyme [Gammaproteobacteria bacterium]MXW46968.1 SUMF1/EgtB/PvdO family nonheme iron enzyme [Gammaproteobacteria bacterium]MYD02859.1 SUMF1/EgtB/PvdO family nonheme iron enzyme [Gammaproteobacteria bacterium]MYI24436.1 SUMF1/EgtB/PvdO family nonheme iron enzyme [Gammaproteobacteria bacterium]
MFALRRLQPDRRNRNSANLSGASADGSARRTGNCERHVIRGGSWVDSPWLLRSAYRHSDSAGGHYDFKVGFRVARALAQ